MHVSKIDTGYYEVKRGKSSKSWWTASNQRGPWFIMSGELMREVDPNGPTGKRIIKAVENYIERTTEAS